MARKSRKPSFDQTLQTLRAQSFDVAPYPGVAGGMLVSKHGVGAVIAPHPDGENAIAFAVHPGILVRGYVARLLDRGYQKFIKTPQYELPATAGQLHAIHTFSEALKLLIGDISLYNESLGTTSDLYEYDRLKGREAEQPSPVRPWELAEGH
jgi:hypothetical protein